jgi:predicted amidohydrolase
VKIALAQINPTVGDFDGNARKILDFTRRAEQGGADLVIFSELSVPGYWPADLLEKPAFVARAGQIVEEIAAKTAGSNIAIILGYVTPAPHGSGKHVRNSAALLSSCSRRCSCLSMTSSTSSATSRPRKNKGSSASTAKM